MKRAGRAGAASAMLILAAACRPDLAPPPTIIALFPTPSFTFAPGLTLGPTSTATTSPTPTLTSLPTGTALPSPTRTLGALQTRTPAPPEACPARRGGVVLEPSFDIEEVESDILRYLNNGGDPARLEVLLTKPGSGEPVSFPYLRANVFSTDVTGDRVDDYVLEVDAETEDQSAIAILVLTCRSGAFEAALVERFISSIDTFVALPGVIDMNADGVPEIVYSLEEFGAGADSTTTVFVLEWDGHAFHHLVSADEATSPFYDNGASMGNMLRIGDEPTSVRLVDVRKMFPDTDGNGTREILLTGGVSGRYWTMGGGPERLMTDTWAWNGQAFTLRSTGFEPPEFRFQAVRDGDAATLRGEYERALAFYQQAIFDVDLAGWNPERLGAEYNAYFMGTPTPLPLPEERPRLSGYSRYRILLLHAILGNDDAALVIYRTLLEKFPPGIAGQPYAALAEAFWEGYQAQGKVADGCERAQAYAADHKEDVLDPLGSNVYGFFYEDYDPADICPFE